MNSTIQSQDSVRDLLAKLLCLLAFSCIQNLDSRDVTAYVENNHLRFCYAITLLVIGIIVLKPLHNHRVICDMIDVMFYEAAYQFFNLYLYFFDIPLYRVLNLSEDAFHIYGSVMAFLFIVPLARMAIFYTDKTTGQALNWPSIGIVGVMVGYSAIRPAPTRHQRIAVWLGILIAIPISYGLTFVKLPWAKVVFSVAGFWIIFKYAKTAMYSAVAIVEENQEITTANFALQAALEKNAEKLSQLEAVSQQRALSFDEQRMIDALRRAQEDIQSRLVDFVEDMVDGSQRPQLSLVKTDKENPAT